MGSHYGVVYCRPAKQADVIAACATVSKRTGVRFLVSSETDGWVAVYPSQHGQDPRITRAMARILRGHILHLLLHDDDVFAYIYLRDGKRVDEYNSVPDYFGRVLPWKRRQVAGKVEVFRDLANADSNTLGELALALAEARRWQSTETTDTAARTHEEVVAQVAAEVQRPARAMERFARALRLPHPLNAFEYFEAGEGEPKAWAGALVPVPDEREAYAADAGGRQAAFAGLANSGLLLLRYPEVGSSPDVEMHSMPSVLPGPAGTWFLHEGSGMRPNPLLQLVPGAQPAPVGFDLPVGLWGCHASRSGRWLVGLHWANAQRWLACWQIESGELAASRAVDRDSHVVGFSLDEGSVWLRTDGSLQRLDAPSLELRRDLVVGERGDVSALHPGGRYAVVALRAERVAIVDLDHGAVAARVPMPARSYAHWLQEALAGRGPSGYNEREHLRQLDFDASGDRLAIATDGAVRVVSWSDLIKPTDELPVALTTAQGWLAEVGSGQRLDAITGATFCQGDRSLVISGLDGTLWHHDLVAASTRRVLQLPGSPFIHGLKASGDGSTLGLVISPERLGPRPGQPQVLIVDVHVLSESTAQP